MNISVKHPAGTIKELETLKSEIEFEYPYIYQVALTQAIEELKKTLPKELIAAQGDPLWGYCPHCTTPIYHYQNPNACRFCLQRVKWDCVNNVEETK